MPDEPLLLAGVHVISRNPGLDSCPQTGDAGGWSAASSQGGSTTVSDIDLRSGSPRRQPPGNPDGVTIDHVAP
jgi:hypothetical protein